MHFVNKPGFTNWAIILVLILIGLAILVNLIIHFVSQTERASTW